ncbi:Z1 domain-containing protein [Streptomyces sp. TBY4]|uniref:Z1 domain-containing protein n=1 Tax=Streptomyces sp. TBY4 TaxID=2962030 RepID=UPI0020B83260|nr:Z1 domain-containing protein [Streptomyces sp. TBY4]MCP3758384.1 Z1 domain-containing protein [Streptomyces sp. TBY4]
MSTTPDDSFAVARRVALAMLPVDRQASPDEVTVAVNAVMGMMAAQGKLLDRDQFTKDLQEMVTTYQETASGLHDDAGHEAWLPDAKNDRTWDFWDRYRLYLEDGRNMPRRVVWRLDQSTDEVLGELEDPRREGRWRRYGLVVGQVQSGKTGHYIGLASKAVDAGYRLIVILAGIHNDLRSQTQLRVDEGLLGFDTQHLTRSDEAGANGRRMGAGAMSYAKQLPSASLTSSAEKGDFDRRTAAKANLPIGSFPVVLVIKKHRKIIDNLREWVTSTHGHPDAEARRDIVRNVPLFVIDDEADNASINTSKDADTDPSKINAAIRELVNSFDKASYVGYTATPYANIYIDPDAEHDSYGTDLFPASFIRTLRAPSNYLGPERVFGLQVDDQEEEDVDPLPLVREVKDVDGWMPAKHKSAHVPTDVLPTSLRQAIQSFVLSCAGRRARGQTTEHNSMLVHVTRFTAVQGLVRDQIDEHLRLIKDSLRDRHGNAAAARMEEFRTLWDRDYVPTTQYFTADEATRLSWDEVAPEILPALRKIEVKAVNGAARDALEYYENRKAGLSVIAVGGEKLSRGLTLEGLTVSYYLRASKTYDTLLQMGRWFGYRPGHEDLCRLYTTATLKRAYVEITAATDELRREVEEMAVLRLTPREFGLKVKASSLGLGVTAANKMRNGTKVLLSYSAEGPETVLFNLSKNAVQQNFETLEAFVSRLDRVSSPMQEAPGTSVVWKDVSPQDIVSGFFSAYQPDRAAQRVRPAFIAEYIRKCAEAGELGSWTVRLVGRAPADHPVDVSGHTVGMITRKPLNDFTSDGRYTIRRVLSPPDESKDLDEVQYKAALAATKKAAEGKTNRKGEPQDPQTPAGPQVRNQRRPDQPLLLIYPVKPPAFGDLDAGTPLIGFAVSFPRSRNQSRTEYVVNDIWIKEDIETDDEGDDE